MVPFETSTITGTPPADEPVLCTADRVWRIVMLANADDPRMPSSLHLLDEIDEIRFGRGDRGADRHERVLDLRIPDPRMSSRHGTLARHGDGWVLDDPSSKNGAVVDSVPTRRAEITEPSIIVLGRSLFLLHRDIRSAGLPDRDASRTDPLQTFDGELGERFQRVAQVAPTPLSVVLTGETGTGKEVVARAIHNLSKRQGAFVAVNCGALPASLIEAELFGHRRGAFTGAIGERPGLVRSADGGTLFLDEIAELPLSTQAVLLRVLQDRVVVPIGEDRPHEVDLRLCCATLRDLRGLVETGGFRPDLYARLLGLGVELPPLRARRADFGIVLRALIEKLPDPTKVRFSIEALLAMLRHGWPLNIRELEKTLHAVVALVGDGRIEQHHLELSRWTSAFSPIPPSTKRSRQEEELRARLVQTLADHGGNILAASRALGTRRTQLYRWAHRFGIDLAAFRGRRPS